MALYYFEYEGIFYTLSFLFSLIGLFYLYQLMKRTNKDLYYGHLLMFLAMISFSLFALINGLSSFQIISLRIIPSALVLVFTILMFGSLYLLINIIKDMADFGQTMMLTDNTNYQKNMIQLLKSTGKTLYVYLSKKKPDAGVVEQLEQNNSLVITTVNAGFESANKIHLEKEDKDTLQDTIYRLLREKRFNTVVIDTITAMVQVESFELPMVIQNYSEIIKQQGAAGYFIAEKDRIDGGTVEDISMILDKIKR